MKSNLLFSCYFFCLFVFLKLSKILKMDFDSYNKKMKVKLWKIDTYLWRHCDATHCLSDCYENFTLDVKSRTSDFLPLYNQVLFQIFDIFTNLLRRICLYGIYPTLREFRSTTQSKIIGAVRGAHSQLWGTTLPVFSL